MEKHCTSIILSNTASLDQAPAANIIPSYSSFGGGCQRLLTRRRYMTTTKEKHLPSDLRFCVLVSDDKEGKVDGGVVGLVSSCDCCVAADADDELGVLMVGHAQ
ncbi:hypothetical protein KCU93_g455, partial [Aureobasidium melanogenum]